MTKKLAMIAAILFGFGVYAGGCATDDPDELTQDARSGIFTFPGTMAQRVAECNALRAAEPRIGNIVSAADCMNGATRSGGGAGTTVTVTWTPGTGTLNVNVSGGLFEGQVWNYIRNLLIGRGWAAGCMEVDDPMQCVPTQAQFQACWDDTTGATTCCPAAGMDAGPCP